MLTSEQINQAVESAMPTVLDGLRKEISERAINSARDAALTAINKAVSEWVVVEIVPEVKKALEDSRAGLVAAVPSIATGITDLLAKSLLESLGQRMSTTWERQKIFKALIGD